MDHHYRDTLTPWFNCELTPFDTACIGTLEANNRGTDDPRQVRIMTFGDKIKEICRIEEINLKEFSRLSTIPYDSIKGYSKDKRKPKLEQIHKIINIPQFSQYKSFLLDEDTPAPDEAEFVSLIQRLKEVDKEEEALDYLRYLLERSKK